MTRAHVLTVLPSLLSSLKIASTGDVIGTVQQDRATTIAGTLGPGPSMIPDQADAELRARHAQDVQHGMVSDQLFTPLLAYVSILNTLTSYERQNGVASYALRGAATLKNHGDVAFEDLFTGDQPSVGAAASVVGADQPPAAQRVRGRRARGPEPRDRRQRAAAQRDARARLGRRRRA